MSLREQYDAKVQQAMSERDFRKRETLFLEAEDLRRQLLAESLQKPGETQL